MSRQFRELLAAAQEKRFACERDVDHWLDDHVVRDAETRIAIKLSLMAQGELRTDRRPSPGELATDTAVYRPEVAPVNSVMERWLRRANLELTRSYTEREVDQAFEMSGLDTMARMSVRAELYDRGLIRAASARRLQAGRDMTAAAERPRGRVLLDNRGQPRTLRSRL